MKTKIITLVCPASAGITGVVNEHRIEIISPVWFPENWVDYALVLFDEFDDFGNFFRGCLGIPCGIGYGPESLTDESRDFAAGKAFKAVYELIEAQREPMPCAFKGKFTYDQALNILDARLKNEKNGLWFYRGFIPHEEECRIAGIAS